MPQANKNMDFAMTAFGAGRTNVLALIEAQRSLMEARRGEIASKADRAVTAVAVEVAVGSQIPSVVQNAASQPSDQIGERLLESQRKTPCHA